MKRWTRLAALLAAIGAFTAPWMAGPAHAVAVGQVDTFSSGTTENWVVGLLGAPHPTPPSTQLGGPAGAADRFLRLTAGGGDGPGSRLAVINFANQWAGDYSFAGIRRISFDAVNLGPTDLTLRLQLSDPTAGPPDHVAVTDGLPLPSGGGWTRLVFDVDAASLFAIIGDAATLLTDVTELRILHRAAAPVAGASSVAEPVFASLGVDNILAEGVPDGGTGVPTPASATLLAIGLGALAMRPRPA